MISEIQIQQEREKEKTYILMYTVFWKSQDFLSIFLSYIIIISFYYKIIKKNPVLIYILH